MLRNPRAAQVHREVVNRPHELGCFELPNCRQVLIEDDAHKMLAKMLADVMLEEGAEE